MLEILFILSEQKRNSEQSYNKISAVDNSKTPMPRFIFNDWALMLTYRYQIGKMFTAMIAHPALQIETKQ